MKLTWLAVACFCIIIFFSGCGNKQVNIYDTYSFGKQVVAEGNSEIELALPFEIGKISKNLELNNTQQVKQSVYAGNNGHINIVITAEAIEAGKKSLDDVLITTIETIKLNPRVSNLEEKVESTTISDVPTKKITLSYHEGKENYGVLEYLLIHENILWRIVYQYKQGDEEGKSLLHEIEDQMTVVRKEITK